MRYRQNCSNKSGFHEIPNTSINNNSQGKKLDIYFDKNTQVFKIKPWIQKFEIQKKSHLSQKCFMELQTNGQKKKFFFKKIVKYSNPIWPNLYPTSN